MRSKTYAPSKPKPVFADELLQKYGLQVEGVINHGNYGVVYEVRRENKSFAFKIAEPTFFGNQRLTEKNQKPQDIIRAEFVPPGHTWLIPRIPISLQGMNGILMPFYDTFADSEFGRRIGDTAARHVAKKATPVAALTFVADLVANINDYYFEMQNARGDTKAHGDIKLENIAVEGSDYIGNKRYLLGDFGSSCYEDWDALSGIRTRVGDPTIRAPELFTDDSTVHPSRQTDSWSIGVNAFFVTTGHELWEHKIDYAQPLAKVGSDLEKLYKCPTLKSDLEERLNEVPRYARPLVKSLLALDPSKRKVADGHLVDSSRKLARRYNPKTNIVDIAKDYGKAIAIAGAIAFGVSAGIIGITNIDTSPPNPAYIVVGAKQVSNAGPVEDLVYEQSIVMHKESDRFIPPVQQFLELKDDAYTTLIAPGDQTFRLLLRALRYGYGSNAAAHAPGNLVEAMGGDRLERMDYFEAASRRLKIALDHQRSMGKKIDVEDVIVEMYWGAEKLAQAKRVAGPDFTSYCNVKIGKEYLIPDINDLVMRVDEYLSGYFASQNPVSAKKMVRFGRM